MSGVRSFRAGPSSRTLRSTYWTALLVASLAVAYLSLVGVLLVEGDVGMGAGMVIGSICLLVGGWSYFARASARAQLEGMWPGLAFPAAFAAFHFASLGLIEAGWYAPELIPMAWSLSVSCLLAWMVGYVGGRGGRPALHEFEPRLGGVRVQLAELIRLSRWGMVLFVAGFAGELLIQARAGLGPFSAAGYTAFKAALNEGHGQASIHLFSQMCATVGAIVMVTGQALARRRLFGSVLQLALVLAYVLALVIQGDRSELAVFVFPFFVARHYFVRPFGLGRTVAVGLIALMLAAGIKAYRGSRATDTTLQKVTDVEWVVGHTADEVGASLDTVGRSMELVPGRFDYFWGQTYVDAVARVVPSLIWNRPDAIVSSSWLTEQTSARKSAGKGGLGFSIVAEAYINFGVIGAPFILALIGWMHGAAERILTRPRLRIELFCLYLIVESALLVHVRNSVVTYLRASIWMATILLALLGTYALMRRLGGAGRIGR